MSWSPTPQDTQARVFPGRLSEDSPVVASELLRHSQTNPPQPAVGESHTPEGKKPYVTPRALAADELPALAEDYARAARD